MRPRKISHLLFDIFLRNICSLQLIFVLQAFSICVACLDGKIADRKGYEYIKKFTTSAQAEAAERQEPSSEAAAAEAYHHGLQQVSLISLV